MELYRFPKIFKESHRFSRIVTDFKRFWSIFRDFHGFPPNRASAMGGFFTICNRAISKDLYKGLYRCSRFSTNFREFDGFSPIFTDVQGFARIFKDFWRFRAAVLVFLLRFCWEVSMSLDQMPAGSSQFHNHVNLYCKSLSPQHVHPLDRIPSLTINPTQPNPALIPTDAPLRG